MSERPVIVLEADAEMRALLANQVGSQIDIASISELESRLSGSVVLLVGPSLSSAADLGELAPILAAKPATGAILLTQEVTTEVLQVALRSGVRDVLAMPLDAVQLQEAITRVGQTLPGAVVLPSSGKSERTGPRARVITVFSTKGGAGKSMLASNVAVTLARRQSEPVILVDADLQFGDIGVMLKLAPRHTIVDAVNNLERLDAQLLQSLLVKHEPSGLLVLAAPLEPAFADQIGAGEMARIMDLLRTMAAFVVVDTPAYFNEVVLGLIEESDDVLLMAGMDIPNIKNVKIGLQTLRLLNTPMNKIKLVLNRANSKVKLDVSEVERTLQIKADAQLPSDVVVPQSVNKGVPVVMDAPKSGVAKAIEALTKQFLDDPKKR